MSRVKLISKCKKDILHVYNRAIEAIKPEKLIKNSVSINRHTLTIKDRSLCGIDLNIDLASDNVHIIGGGKSVLGMACGLAEIAIKSGKEHLFSHGCLSLPIGLESNLNNDEKTRDLLGKIGVKCSYGSLNNLPDVNSIEASQYMLEQISKACEHDRIEGRHPLFLVLISGGGSACLTSPRFINLEQKLHLTQYLVEKGANIVELNKVRRFFSNIKGGQLAKYILESHPDSKVVSLILSDVIGDRIEFIASGPTNLDVVYQQVNHRQMMLDIMEKYNYPFGNLIRHIGEKQDGSEISKANYAEGRLVVNCIIGNNNVALEAGIKTAKSLGYHVECLGNDLNGYTEQIVEDMVRSGSKIAVTSRKNSNGILVIGGGEAVVNKLDGETWGKGGRAQEMALDYMISQMKDETFDCCELDLIEIFLAGGTDGQDGPTDVAGCLASSAEYTCLNEKPFNLHEAIRAKKAHDAYNFWTKYKPDWLVKTGLTGTNVMDLYIYILFDAHLCANL